jgi:predicted Zn-dependent protease
MSNDHNRSRRDSLTALGSEEEIEADLDAWDDLFDNLHAPVPATPEPNDNAAGPGPGPAPAAGPGPAPVSGRPPLAGDDFDPEQILGRLFDDDSAVALEGQPEALGAILGADEPAPPPASDGGNAPAPIIGAAAGPVVPRSARPTAQPFAEAAAEPGPAAELHVRAQGATSGPGDDDLAVGSRSRSLRPTAPPPDPPPPTVTIEPMSARSTAASWTDDGAAAVPRALGPQLATGPRRRTIVRREELERARGHGAEEPAEHGPAAQVSADDADEAALEFERDRVTREGEYQPEPEPEPEPAEEFYDDIEIAADAAQPPGPVADMGDSEAVARRLNLHVARRAHLPGREGDTSDKGPVVEIVAEPSGATPRTLPANVSAQVVSGIIRSGADDGSDAVIASDVRPSHRAATVDGGAPDRADTELDAEPAVSDERVPEAQLSAADQESSPFESGVEAGPDAWASALDSLGPERGLSSQQAADDPSDVVFAGTATDGIRHGPGFVAASRASAVAEVEPAGTPPDDALTADTVLNRGHTWRPADTVSASAPAEPTSESSPSVPSAPAGTSPVAAPLASAPRLDLDAIQLPFSAEADPYAGIAEAELWLARYEVEIEQLDEPKLLSAMRAEAGRLAGLLGHAERSAEHYLAAAQADPRSVVAASAVRRHAQAAGRWDDAQGALAAEMKLASPAERRALAAWRADLSWAADTRDEAAAVAAALLTESPGEPRALLASIETAYCDGRFDDCVDLVDQLTAVQDSELAQRALAVLRCRLIDGARAEAAWQKVLERWPDCRDAGWGLGWVAAAGDSSASPGPALAHLKDGRLVDLDPELAAALARRQALFAADAATRLADLKSAAALATGDPALFTELARCHEAAGNGEAAVRAYLHAAAASAAAEEQAHCYRRAARLLAAGLGSPEDTIEALGRLHSIDPHDAEAAALLEDALAERGDVDTLVAMDRRAAQADANNGVFERLRTAKRLFAAERWDEAIAELEDALANAPDSPMVADALGRVLAVAGRTEQRGALLQRLAETEAPHRDPEVAAIRAAQAAEDIAFELSQAQDGPMPNASEAIDRAMQLWEAVLEFAPESLSAATALVGLAELRGETAEIVESLGRAQASAHNSARVAGFALRRCEWLLQGTEPNPEDAEQVLREYTMVSPSEPRVTFALAAVLAGQKRWDEVAYALDERAASLGAGNEAHALRFRAASILHEHTEEISRVVELLTPVATAYPGFSPAQALLDMSRRQLGDSGSPSADFDRRIESSGLEQEQFALLIREAEAAEFSGAKLDRAVELYGKAMEIRPEDPLARAGFARAAEVIGENGRLAQLALDELKHASDRDDKSAKADAYEELARIDYELRNDVGSALFSFECAVKIDPARWSVLRRLEVVCIAERRYADLLQLYAWQLGGLGQSSEAAAVSAARVRILLHTVNDPAELVSECRRAYELDQRNQLALIQLEAASREQGVSEELAALQEAVARYFEGDDRARAAFLTRAGETREALNDIEGAIACFRTAATLLPGYVPALGGWRRAALRGQLWIDLGQAAHLRAETVSSSGKKAAFYHLAGVAFMDKALSPERALAALQQVLVDDPSHVDAYLRLRLLLEQQGAHEQLVALLNQRLSVEDAVPYKVELHLAIAKLYAAHLDDVDSARPHLRAAIELQPDNAAANAQLANIAWDRGEWAEAASMLAAQARHERDRATLLDLYRRIGTIYREHEPNDALAIAAYDRLLAAKPDDEEALEHISTISVRSQDWTRALSACERLLQRTKPSPQRRIEILHRIGEIHAVGTKEPHRVERAYRAALEADPTSSVALDRLTEFYRQSSDPRSMRVHLDSVATSMRRRLSQTVRDGVSYRVLARALAAREEAGATGSLEAAVCAAELAMEFEGGEAAEAELAGLAGLRAPAVKGLAAADIDDLLFHRDVPSGLRQIFRALGDRLAKATSADVKRLGIGRSERIDPRSEPLGQVVADVAAQLGVSHVELYASTTQPKAVASDSASPLRLIFGTDLVKAASPAEARFLAARGLKLATSSMAIPGRMTSRAFGALLVALLRSFRPDFSPPGVDLGAVATEQQRLRKVVPGNLLQQLGPYALECASLDFNQDRIWEAIIHTGNRAGLLAAGSVRAAINALMRVHGYASIAEATADPFICELMRFSVSEDHVALQRAMKSE